MSVNKYKPHVFVLPEDDANHQLANGFLLGMPTSNSRAIQVLPGAGGWSKVRESFEADYVDRMKALTNRYMILLVDFDKDVNRRNEMTKVIPKDLIDRVFVIGVWSEPEDLRRIGLGTSETVGYKLATECRDEVREVWNHDLLRLNATELSRMTQLLRPILFPTT